MNCPELLENESLDSNSSDWWLLKGERGEDVSGESGVVSGWLHSLADVSSGRAGPLGPGASLPLPSLLSPADPAL